MSSRSLHHHWPLWPRFLSQVCHILPSVGLGRGLESALRRCQEQGLFWRCFTGYQHPLIWVSRLHSKRNPWPVQTGGPGWLLYKLKQVPAGLGT